MKNKTTSDNKSGNRKAIRILGITYTAMGLIFLLTKNIGVGILHLTTAVNMYGISALMKKKEEKRGLSDSADEYQEKQNDKNGAARNK